MNFKLMKKYIVKKEQLLEYVENKKAENIFYEIIEKLHINNKNINENISIKNVNQSIINDYKRKGLISERVFNLLIKYNIINDNYDLL